MKVLSVVIAVVSAASVLSQDAPECFPKPGEPRVHPGECCKAQKLMPEDLKKGFMKCKEEYPRPPRPTGPPPTGPPPTPTPEMVNNRVCMAECIFNETGLVKDGALDEAAVGKMIKVEDPDFTTVVEAAKTKCLGSYKKEIESSYKCKSGAHEFKHCLEREVFKNCPASAWTASSECDTLKAKVDKCPHMHIMMGPKPPHHDHH